MAFFWHTYINNPKNIRHTWDRFFSKGGTVVDRCQKGPIKGVGTKVGCFYRFGFLRKFWSLELALVFMSFYEKIWEILVQSSELWQVFFSFQKNNRKKFHLHLENQELLLREEARGRGFNAILTSTKFWFGKWSHFI